MSHGEPAKWHMPGWRIEQRFAPGVLIGNWAEQQHQFQKDNFKHNSTYRLDFSDYGSFKPDVFIRRKSQLQNNGLSKELLFYHHGNRYSNNMISWYDEHYNKRERDENNKLPELRNWDSNQLAWVPEKTDYPIQGAPTNFGLRQKLHGDAVSAGTSSSQDQNSDYHTTYRASYSHLPREAMCLSRFATPKGTSTSLHMSNAVNKDLHLRGKSDLKPPQSIRSVSTPSSAPAVPPIEAAVQ